MIATIISYCNNDFKFIEENLIQSSKFSDEIYISYCEKSFDGETEDVELLNKMQDIAKKYKATPIPIAYQEMETPKFHHNIFRFLPTWFTHKDYILFLDADEIIEGDLFLEYLKTEDYLKYDVIALECYWYFREKNYRAKQTEMAGVMCKRSICGYNYIFSQAERWEFYNRPELKHKINVKHNDKIMCHHYSWVRTKDEMLKKVKSWAHRNDTNWDTLIEQEFSHDFDGTDFVHKYQYEIL